MKRIFLLLIIPFIIGIFISYKIEVSVSSITFMISLSILGLLITYVFNRGYTLSLCFVFLFLGMIMTTNSLESTLVNFVDKETTLEGVVESKSISNETKSTYVIKVDKLSYEDKVYRIEEKILLNYFDGEVLNLNDEIRITGVLLLPKENTNPGLFNYRLYLQTKNIHTTLNANSSSIDIISPKEFSYHIILKVKFKEQIRRILDTALNEKNSNIMGSIILGDSSFLDEETYTRFRELGLTHILAVSGLHIGIIYLFISKTLGFFRLSKRSSVIIALIVVWIYGYLIGFPASVLRSSIMFSLLSLSSLVYRRYDSINTLSLAALLLLFISPLWIFDVGFQLSFVATASIIIFTPRISWLISIYSKKGAKLLSALIAVQIGLFPVLAYHFNSYAALSLISNLILIPIFSFSLVLCFILILISFVFMKISLLLGFLLNIILHFASLVIDIFYSFSYLNISLPSLGLVYIITYYFLILVCLRVIKIDMFKPKINKLILYYLIIASINGLITYFTFNITTLEFIDVGQGDSCLVSTKNSVFLIDAGGNVFGDFDVGERVVLPYLLKKGISKLDAVFITHFHEDHAEGVVPLINNIKIDNIFIGYENNQSHLYKKIMYSASKYNIKVSRILEGDIIRIDNNNIVEVLNPLPNLSPDNIGNENNLSLALILKSHGKSIFFTGDIEKEVEHRIVNDYRLGKIDIIKVPHHGSPTSSTLELVNEIKPSYAVIQVGKNNFGHPNEEVIERYKQVGTDIFRNDKNGLITFKIHKEGVEIYTYITDKASISDIIEKYSYELLFMIIYIGVSVFICTVYVDCNSNSEELLLICYINNL